MNNIANLHFTKSNGVTYYRYRLPDGNYESLGKDKKISELAAAGLNLNRQGAVKTNNLPVGGNSKTIRNLINLYEPVKLRSSKSRATKKEWIRKFKLYKQWMDGWKVSRVSVMDLDMMLEEKALSYDTYHLHRLFCAELFTYALGKGWRREIDGNPGKALLPPKLARIKVPKLRKRMSLEIFYAIRKQSPPWLQLAMDLSLQIGIRRGDISNLKLEDFKDGYLYFIPSKTADMLSPVAIKIPLTKEITAMLSRSRNMAPLSPFFLHRSNMRYRCNKVVRQHRTQVVSEQITRYFKIARDRAQKEQPELFKAFKKDSELPSFHEIRSLCAKLYKNQGRRIDEIQLLLGHADESMTKFYQSGYEIEWQEARAGLEL